MMKLKTILFLALVLLISANIFGQKTEPVKVEPKKNEDKPTATVKLPTVKEILDKYIQAIGGREAINKIKTRVTKASVEMAPMGIKGTGEIYQAGPNKMLSKLNLGGIGEILEGFDGTTAWSVNPFQGSRTKTGNELLQTKLSSDFYRDLNFDKNYPKMEVKGIEKVGDKEAYVIVATPTGLESEKFYFDTQTGFLLRSDNVLVSPEGNMPAKTFYDDIREVDGLKIPFKTRTVLPQFEIVINSTEIKHDVSVDDKLFTKPAEK